MQPVTRTLEEQRLEFQKRKLLATPIAGTIAWTAVLLSALFCSKVTTVWVLFIATGSIMYLAIGISRLTGENFLAKNAPKNVFDRLFLFTQLQSMLVFAIAIPFFLQDYTSLPLTVGILTGLMWLPLSWIIDHWIGIFHALVRTTLVLALWYLFPENRFVVISLAIVVLYLITLFVMLDRYKKISQG